MSDSINKTVKKKLSLILIQEYLLAFASCTPVISNFILILFKITILFLIKMTLKLLVLKIVWNKIFRNSKKRFVE